jgi:hypothetical protein
MAELFGVDVRTVNEHLQNIFKTNELLKDSTIRKIRIVQKEGIRDVSRDVDFYNLDAIIAVGYRVNSYQATQFRIWSTKTLKEFIIKGGFTKKLRIFTSSAVSITIRMLKAGILSYQFVRQRLTNLYSALIFCALRTEGLHPSCKLPY